MHFLHWNSAPAMSNTRTGKTRTAKTQSCAHKAGSNFKSWFLTSIVLCPILMSSHEASAKTIYLKCSETKVLKDEYISETGGRRSVETKNDPVKEISIMIDTDNKKAQVYGSDFQLSSTPTTLTLTKDSKDNSNDYGRYSSSTTKDIKFKKYQINRKTLQFEYVSFGRYVIKSNVSGIGGLSRGFGLNSTSEWNREAQGKCAVEKTPKNNKI